ncbi:hypothetical protein TYRP_005337, partial [Tyrophagus putrescentiae]
MRHLLALHHQCDPMVTLSNKEEGRNDQTELEYLNKVKCHRRQFLFPLIIILLTSLFGTFGMQVQNGSNFTLSSLISSPVIFTHQVIQVAIWRQMDVAIGLDVVISLLVFGALVVTPAIGRKYQLTVNQTKDSNRTQVFLGDTKLSKAVSKEMRSFQLKVKGPSQLVLAVFLFGLYLFLYANLLLNQKYQLNTFSALFWLFLFPLFMFYMIYALFGTSLFIVFACRYIYTLQRFLLKRYRYLESKNRRGSNFETIPITGDDDEASFQNEIFYYKSCHNQVTAFWASFRVLQSRTVFLCRLIAEYNRFCWPLLSALFPYYILVQCYLLYVIFFQGLGLGSSFSRVFFYFAIAQCNTAVFYLCKVATAVGRLNGQILLSAEGQQSLGWYCFKLLNLYSINSQTYHLILSYGSAYFMFICKNQYN